MATERSNDEGDAEEHDGNEEEHCGLCPEHVRHAGRVARFCVQFTSSLAVHAAPAFLALLDGASHCLLVALLSAHAHQSQSAISGSLSDVVSLSIARCIFLLVASSFGTKRNMYKPLAACSIALFLLTATAVATKAALFEYGSYKPLWLPPCIFALSGSLAALHVGAACARVGAAKRSALSQMGVFNPALLVPLSSDASSTAAAVNLPADANTPAAMPLVHTKAGVSSSGNFSSASYSALPQSSSHAHAGKTNTTAEHQRHWDGTGSARDDEANSSGNVTNVVSSRQERLHSRQLGTRTDESTGMTMPLHNGDLDADMRPEQLADNDSIFKTIAGNRLHFKSYGQQEVAHIVLLLHGFGGGTFSWRHIAPYLALRTGCRVIVVDRPGFGLSCNPEDGKSSTSQNSGNGAFSPSDVLHRSASTSRAGHPNSAEPAGPSHTASSSDNFQRARQPRNSTCQSGKADPDDAPDPYSARGQARLFVQLLAEEGAEQVALVGHSDGCLIAILTAQDALSRSESPFVLQCIGLVAPNLTRNVLPTTTRLLLNTSLPLAMIRPLLRSELGELASRRACYNSGTLQQQVIDLYRKPLHVRGWDKALQRMNKRREEISTTELAEAVNMIASLPTKVVAGRNDCVVPQERIQAMVSELPQAEVCFFADCGHLPHEECPDELLEQLIPLCHTLVQRAQTYGKAQAKHLSAGSSQSLHISPFATGGADPFSRG